jgi:hypothetical protein
VRISTTTRTISKRGNERRPYRKKKGTGSWLKTAWESFFNGGRLEAFGAAWLYSIAKN